MVEDPERREVGEASADMNRPFVFSVDVEGDYWDENQGEGITRGVPLLLEMLERLDVKATFFWTASKARSYPSILDQTVAAGHEVACHGLFHENMASLTPERQENVLREAAAILRSAAGTCVGFRAPRLRVNYALFDALRRQGFLYDSSIPFWGVRRYKYGKRFDRPGLVELKCVPSYAFRLAACVGRDAVHRSSSRLGYTVLFVHPWEVIDAPPGARSMPWRRKANFINTLNMGAAFLTTLECELRSLRNTMHFVTCAELGGATLR